MSIFGYVETNAPFLLACGPVVATAAVCFVIWKVFSKQTTSPSPGGRGQTQRPSANGSAVSGSPKDEDDYVFMDNSGGEADGYPYTHSEAEEGDHIPYSPQLYSEEDMVHRSHQFYVDMNKRRSVRFFSDRPVPEEVIKNIIKTAGK